MSVWINLHAAASLAGRVADSSPSSPPAEEVARDSRESRSCPRGLSRSDLEQLAQGGEDLVQDLEVSDED